MRGMRRGWLFAFLCVVIAVCVAALSLRIVYVADWSAGARASITAQDQALVAQLKGPLTVTAYARPGTQRAKVQLLVQRFARFKRDLALKFVDPDLDPITTQDAGITVDGELVLTRGDRSEHVTQLSEAAFATALARLARGGSQLVAFITGDGERDPAGADPADLGHFVQRLGAHGIRVVPLNLADAAEVPRNAQLVVLASPQASLSPAAVAKLQGYLDNGGNLLWLTEPGDDDLGLAPLSKALGIQRLPGTLVDPGNGRDPRIIIATSYPPQAITQGFKLNTSFPRAAALAEQTSAGWDAKPLLQSSPRGWDDTGATDATQAIAAPATGDLKGALGFGYALTRLSPSPARNSQRVVVIGDGDFLANAYLGDAGNLALGERIVDWLLGDDALAQIPASAPDSKLAPTRLQLGTITFGYLVALPLLLILIGGWIGWRRRRR